MECYTFEERCLEDFSISLGDGTKKIFLNTRGKNFEELTTDLQDFLNYVKNPALINRDNNKLKELDNRVKKIKADAEVSSKYMTLKNWIEEERDLAMELDLAEGLEQGKIQGRIELIRTKYLKGYDIEKTIEIIELEPTFVSHIYQFFKDYPNENDLEITKRYLQEIQK